LNKAFRTERPAARRGRSWRFLQYCECAAWRGGAQPHGLVPSLLGPFAPIRACGCRPGSPAAGSGWG